METRVIWKDAMAFEGRVDGFSVPMDATPPLGHHYGPNPKELVLAGLAGCAGMDVIGMLKKHKQFIDQFEIICNVLSSTSEHPLIFKEIELVFVLNGSIDPDYALEAVELSQRIYSGVSAMLASSCDITWKVILNDEELGQGIANFGVSDEYYQSAYEG